MGQVPKANRGGTAPLSVATKQPFPRGSERGDGLSLVSCGTRSGGVAVCSTGVSEICGRLSASTASRTMSRQSILHGSTRSRLKGASEMHLLNTLSRIACRASPHIASGAESYGQVVGMGAHDAGSASAAAIDLNAPPT